MNNRITFLIFIISINSIFSQVNEYYMNLHKAITKGNYLGYLNLIKDDIKKTNDYNSLSSAYSFVSDYKKSQEIFFKDKHLKEFQEQEIKEFNDKRIVYNKITENSFLKKCKEYDIVLFNEAHHKPLHRLFLKKKLKKLYKIGFRYFFIEALYDKEINERKYPIIKSLSIKEPSFGLLIREAINLGFKIYGYETRGTRGDNREIEMFKNISSKLQKLKGKSILLGGYSHIANPIPEVDVITLGQLLNKEFKTLSIDQTTYTEEYDPKMETKRYKDIAKKIKKPIILDIKSGLYYNYTVIHPRTFFTDNHIANWYFNKRKHFYFETKNINKMLNDNEYLLQIYLSKEYENEAEKALPLFQKIVKKTNQSIKLPKYNIGKTILIVRDKKGKIIYKANGHKSFIGNIKYNI